MNGRRTAVLGWISIAVLAVEAIYIAHVWPHLPAVLPSHFGLDGRPNRHAPRGVLWLVWAIAVFVCGLTRVFARYPQVCNMPAAPGTPDRARQERLTQELLDVVGLEMAVLFGYVLWTIVQVGTQQRRGASLGFVPLMVVVVTATVVIYLNRVRGGKKP